MKKKSVHPYDNMSLWKTLNLNTMGEYHDLYLTLDIPLLANVFENFRKTCLQYYKLDACHYFISPGLSWDAMLENDRHWYVSIHWKRNERWQLIYANRYARVNNKYMHSHNAEESSKYIMYLDVNNICG